MMLPGMNWNLAAAIPDLFNNLGERRQYLFLLLLGFLVSFGFIRLSTRLMRSPKVTWWPGSVKTASGVHVHHLVFGIVMMMLAGTLSFAVPISDFWYGLWATLFGIGMGLTIDEYALWVRLDDVYWAEEGRSSIDAALIAALFIGLVLVSSLPDSISTENLDVFLVGFAAAALHFTWVLISLSKQRFGHALIGTFIPGVAIYSSLRLGKPTSLWAKRFYATRNERKQARSERRFRDDRRTHVSKERLRDLLGGVTEEEYKARLAAANAPADPSPEER